jgi:hypothetical protein
VLTLNRVVVLALAAVAAFGVWRVALPAEHKASEDVGNADGTVLVRADAGSYCVQVGPPGTVSHLAGPNGAATAGPC